MQYVLKKWYCWAEGEDISTNNHYTLRYSHPVAWNYFWVKKKAYLRSQGILELYIYIYIREVKRNQQLVSIVSERISVSLRQQKTQQTYELNQETSTKFISWGDYHCSRLLWLPASPLVHDSHPHSHNMWASPLGTTSVFLEESNGLHLFISERM